MAINLDITLPYHKPFTTGVMKATTLLGVRTEPVQNPENGVVTDLPVLVSILMNISFFNFSQHSLFISPEGGLCPVIKVELELLH